MSQTFTFFKTALSLLGIDFTNTSPAHSCSHEQLINHKKVRWSSLHVNLINSNVPKLYLQHGDWYCEMNTGICYDGWLRHHIHITLSTIVLLISTFFFLLRIPCNGKQMIWETLQWQTDDLWDDKMTMIWGTT